MLDLETVSTSTNSVVLTFGAIRFDPFGDDRNSQDGKTIHMDTFYRRIDPESFDWADAEIDEGTIAWWAKQDAAAQEEAFGTENRHDIRTVMVDFYKWSRKGFADVWANGPLFDIAILESINKNIQRGNPWKYWQVKDCRTLYGLVEHERPNPMLHHALWDCWSQLVAVQSCYRNLGLTSEGMPAR